MREMKVSGIQWIGNIPLAWEIDRIKSRVLTHFGGCWGTDFSEEIDENAKLCIRIADFDFEKQFPKNETSTIRKYTLQQIHNGKLLDGDIIVEKSGGGEKTPVGRTILFDASQFEGQDVLFANFSECFRPTNVNNRFFAYLLKNFYYTNDMHMYFNQTTGLQNLDIPAVLSANVAFPPLAEQRLIADFLDCECGKIDGIIADIQSQIETLEQYKRSVITEAVTKGLNPDVEMKDSGIQWIGIAPNHWEFIRGKYILQYMQKPIKPDDGVITCFRDGEVTLRSKRREEGFTIAEKEIGYQGIDVGDLVVHGMDGFAGAIGISDSRGKASPVLNVLETEQNKKYIMYYLRGMAYSDVFTALATGIRVRSCDLRWNKLADLMYPAPPIEEQNEIVNHIDTILNKANSIIADKKSQLDTLEQYKKSLIYEYVTGKKEVTA